ncbi:MAG: type II toxin-antitoxin system RelE/ParE family toxin [Candidatus Rokubacteria bacterium]|nr:type II toxin-antitoxin system RelE/ParE family toxin [Candidatus Rokubacteria bacterium]
MREAARWHERQRPGLGRAFLHQIDVLLGRIREDPLQHQVVYRSVRRAIPRRFPYGLFYRIDGSAVLVFAVVHLHRDPST